MLKRSMARMGFVHSHLVCHVVSNKREVAPVHSNAVGAKDSTDLHVFKEGIDNHASVG